MERVSPARTIRINPEATTAVLKSLRELEPEQAALVLKELRENFPRYAPSKYEN